MKFVTFFVSNSKEIRTQTISLKQIQEWVVELCLIYFKKLVSFHFQKSCKDENEI